MINWGYIGNSGILTVAGCLRFMLPSAPASRDAYMAGVEVIVISLAGVAAGGDRTLKARIGMNNTKGSKTVLIVCQPRLDSSALMCRKSGARPNRWARLRSLAAQSPCEVMRGVSRERGVLLVQYLINKIRLTGTPQNARGVRSTC